MKKSLINIKLLLFFFITLILFGVVCLKYKKNSSSIKITKSEIKFDNYLLETKQTLPRLFIQPPLELNINGKYSYSIFNDLQSNQEFIRIDKMIIQTGTVWFNNVTAFYIYDSQSKQYKRVLASTLEQNKARFPETNIISQYPLIIKFYYDISKPNSCYGVDCLSYWANFYQWDSKKKQFNLVNEKYKEFYIDLYNQYEEMNKKGCSLEDVENKGLIIFEDVYKSNKTNYCKGSSREELNKFFEVKNKIFIQLSESNKTVDYSCSEGKSIRTGYSDKLVKVKLSDGREYNLKQVSSASGIRFANSEIDDSVVFWSKSNTAFFQENGVNTYNSCVMVEKYE